MPLRDLVTGIEYLFELFQSLGIVGDGATWVRS